MDHYPAIDDEQLQFLVAHKAEFRDLGNPDNLYPHQEFVRRFLSPYTPYRTLLLYHKLGSGKSIACIAVAVDHYLHDGKKCFVVTKGKSGTDNFIGQIKLFHEMSSRKDDWSEKVFKMKHYQSFCNEISTMTDDDVVQILSNIILIIDEAHNVKFDESDKSFYNCILRLLRASENTKVILATGTPMTDNPEEIKSLLGICNLFRNDAKSLNGIISFNEKSAEQPASSYLGTYNIIPDICIYASNMIAHQRLVYSQKYSEKRPDDIYRELIHISLFCFSDQTYGREITDSRMSRYTVRTKMVSASNQKNRELVYTKFTIFPQYASALTGKQLEECSAKYSAIMKILEATTGNVFIFIEEVQGSGLILFTQILEKHGYELYLGEEIESMSVGKRYTFCVGTSEVCPNILDRLTGFNSVENRNGDYVRILVGSKVISESITLKNVRHFHCLTPHWNDSAINQAIGRVVRNGSHLALDEEFRHVDIYIHAAVFPDVMYEKSVDLKKLLESQRKEKGIREVESLLKKSAVDRYVSPESAVEVTEFVNFSIAYMQDYPRNRITNYFQTQTESDIYSLAETCQCSQIMCNEALSRMIFENTPIQNQGSTGYLRAYENNVFLVQDPSLPFERIPDAKITNAVVITEESVGEEEVETESVVFPTKPIRAWVQEFRYLPVKTKADVVEKYIATGREDFLDDTLFIKIDSNYFHLLLYRDLNSSYTSSNPIPKKPLSKTRIYDGAKWENVENADVEAHVFSSFKSHISDILNDSDEQHELFGILSTIDGNLRIRMEDVSETSRNDSRFVRRGIHPKSIKKDLLLEILNKVTGEALDSETSSKLIADKIDAALVKKGLYLLI